MTEPSRSSLDLPLFDPLKSAAPLIVYVDIKSPYAFVAKDPTRRLAESLDIRVDWRPLTLDIPSYLGSARLDDKGKVAAANRSPSHLSTRPLAVVLDIKDAQSYLAKDPTYALVDDLGIKIDWLPFVPRPLRRHTAVGEDRGSRHRRFRAAYLKRSIARYASIRGRDLGQYVYRMWLAAYPAGHQQAHSGHHGGQGRSAIGGRRMGA